MIVYVRVPLLVGGEHKEVGEAVELADGLANYLVSIERVQAEPLDENTIRLLTVVQTPETAAIEPPEARGGKKA